MSYTPIHPSCTATVKRRVTVAGAGGKILPTTPTTVGTITGGGFEDLDEETTLRLASGRSARLNGRYYADAALDLPVLRHDVVEFTDPSTSEPRSLEVINRRGPFDPTDTEDHFELDLASEQPAGA
jgi:hypothetical protein